MPSWCHWLGGLDAFFCWVSSLPPFLTGGEWWHFLDTVLTQGPLRRQAQ